jgi:hypothetical protein
VLASGVFAQSRSNTAKLSVTFGLNGTAIMSDDLNADQESGPGVHVGVGYGFSPRFALFLDAYGASIKSDDDDYVLSHVDLGLRFHFANPNRAFIPYLEAALTGRGAAFDDLNVDGNDDIDLEATGGGFTLGGGILYFFNPRLAFNAHAKWTKGEFSRVRVENVTVSGFEIDATSVRIGVGLTWFPQGAR